MLHYLHDMYRLKNDNDFDYNWSAWDWRQIHKGDRFYMVKVGLYGQTGIVASGTVTSEPYKGEDWSGKGRETYYVDFLPDVLLNPDALPILTRKELTEAIPDFEWDRGHSGLVLTDDQATRLDALWQEFLKRNKPEFEDIMAKGKEDVLYIRKEPASPKTKDKKETGIDLTKSPMLQDYVIGWNKITDFVDDIDNLSLHDSTIDKLTYNAENDEAQYVEIRLFDSSHEITIDLRFSELREIKWDNEIGNNFAWQYNLEYFEKGKMFVFELDSLYLRIICKKIEVVSVQKYTEP